VALTILFCCDLAPCCYFLRFGCIQSINESVGSFGLYRVGMGAIRKVGVAPKNGGFLPIVLLLAFVGGAFAFTDSLFW